MESPLQHSLCSLGWFFFLRRVMSDCGKFDGLEKRKRTETINLAVSVFHSFFSGLGALIAIAKMPEILDDMVYAHSNLSACVTSFTFGYFVYDFFDLLAASRWSISKNNFDIILHHVLVICCFGSCVVQQRYMGLSMLSILMEVNSVFLHLRKISRNFNIKSGIAYHAIVAMNFLTLLAFRIAVSYKMIVWLSTVDRSGIPTVVFYLGVIAMPVIAAMNCTLFYRCLRVDILRPLSRPIKKD